MPVDLSYKGMFVDVFLCGGIVFAYLALVVYRIMAASLFPRLNNKTCYWLFSLMTIIAVSMLLPLALRGGVAVDDSVRGALALVVFCVPCIIMGTVGIVLRWRWRTVLFSCISEILLFPVWFFLLFKVCLFFDCSD